MGLISFLVIAAAFYALASIRVLKQYERAVVFFFGKFEGRSAITTWLTRVVINAALMVRRKRSGSMLRSLHDLGGNDAVFLEAMQDVRPNPEHAYSRVESFEFLDSVLKEMNPLLREAATLAYYNELSIEEASTALGVAAGTYKARLFRARRYLQKKARKHRSKFLSSTRRRDRRA